MRVARIQTNERPIVFTSDRPLTVDLFGDDCLVVGEEGVAGEPARPRVIVPIRVLQSIEFNHTPPAANESDGA